MRPPVRRRLVSLGAGCFFVGTLVALGVGHADPPPASRPRLSLVQCVAEAERTYPGMAAARHKIAASEAQLNEAWVAPFLNVSTTGVLSISPTARGNSTYSPDAFGQNPFLNDVSYLTRWTIETGVPVSPWTWYRLGRVRDAARAGVRANEFEAVKTRLELRTNVRRAFFALQLARDTQYLLDRAKGYLDEAERHINTLRDSDAGAVSQNDLRQLRMNRYELLARKSEADRGEATARTTLGLLTGTGDTIDIVDEPLCAYGTTLHPLVHYLTEARLNRPEVGMIRAGVSAREAALSIQRGAYFPDIALGMSVGIASAPTISEQPNPFSANNSNYAFWGAALVLRWNFEPLANTFRVRRLTEELAMTEAQQRLALGGIAVEVTEVYQRALDAQNRERFYGLAEAEGYEWFTAVFQEYEAGTGELSSIITPLRQYLQMRFSHLQTVHDYNVALAQLAMATGRDELPGRPDPACVSPTTVASPSDTDGGVSEEEINRILNESLGGEDASVSAPPPRDAATGGARPRTPARPGR